MGFRLTAAGHLLPGVSVSCLKGLQRGCAVALAACSVHVPFSTAVCGGPVTKAVVG